MMRNLVTLTLAVLLIAAASPPVLADKTTIEDFKMQPQERWQFITDTVMGGESSGQVAFMKEGGSSFARMTGRVSTANRGGFIQMRMNLATQPPQGAKGVRLVVRGNNQRYFAHLRTSGTILPWQYYQAGFDVKTSWTEVRLPFDSFAASGALLRSVPRADSLSSVAVVAYGRDHNAQIDVREVGFY
jgi:hypothetical protein